MTRHKATPTTVSPLAQPLKTFQKIGFAHFVE